ncbi:MAG: 50S ribosomal protein L11 methyltransferase [Clostridia bacterium]
MKWLEIAVYTTDAGIEPVCGALSSAGLDQVSIEESRERAMAFLNERAIYWDFADADKIGTDTPCVKTYVSDLPENEPLLSAVKDAIARLRTLELNVDMGSLSLIVTHVDDADWENNWKAYYKPLPIGERLLVLPSWEPEPTDNTRTVLLLDPGVAFGTGAHHTTRMCLEFLERTVTTGNQMLDLGCGSGILSIAALLLGAKFATAVDIDPIAEHIAAENAGLNGISTDSYRIEIGDLLCNEALCEHIAGQYDVVAANIVADVIIRLAPFAKRCCKMGAAFIVSGVIDEREADVVTKLQETGFCIEKIHRCEGWVAILARG